MTACRNMLSLLVYKLIQWQTYNYCCVWRPYSITTFFVPSISSEIHESVCFIHSSAFESVLGLRNNNSHVKSRCLPFSSWFFSVAPQHFNWNVLINILTYFDRQRQEIFTNTHAVIFLIVISFNSKSFSSFNKQVTCVTLCVTHNKLRTSHIKIQYLSTYRCFDSSFYFLFCFIFSSK
jgi:hypothetical protein